METGTTETESTTTLVANDVATFEIPEGNIELLEERLTKLAKRAEKLGCPVSWSWGESHTLMHTRACPSCDQGCRRCNWQGYISVPVEYRMISVSTARPKLAGWEFVGTLDLTSIPGQVMRMMVPGQQCPEYAIGAAPGQCDHCGKRRMRAETFIVRHESGEVKVVGRQCVGLFLGLQAPSTLAAMLTSIRSVVAACEEEAERVWAGVGSAGSCTEPTVSTLAMAYSVVRQYGGYRPSALKDGSTRSTLQRVLWPSGEHEKQESREVFDGFAPCDVERAWRALAWLATTSPTQSDLHHNVHAVMSRDVVRGKHLGFLCALIPMMDRETMAKREPRKTSDHVGVVGKRADLGTGTVRKVVSWDTQWGRGYRVIVELESGAIVVWKTSSKPSWVTDGERCSVRGTVKAHSEYQGSKQTEITRAELTRIEEGVSQ